MDDHPKYLRNPKNDEVWPYSEHLKKDHPEFLSCDTPTYDSGAVARAAAAKQKEEMNKPPAPPKPEDAPEEPEMPTAPGPDPPEASPPATPSDEDEDDPTTKDVPPPPEDEGKVKDSNTNESNESGAPAAGKE